jgi:hypothetical protein
MLRLLTLAAPLAGAPFLALPLAAQRSERTLQDEMAFARELAVRYQYLDLAENVLTALGKEKLSEAQKERLDLVQCQVYSEGAKRESDAKKRLETFAKAAKAYSDFFAAHDLSGLKNEAERSYLGLVNNYGRALELALEGALGDESKALRETLKKVLDEGLERTANLKDAYEDRELTPEEKLERWRLMLDRAQMYITHGDVDAERELEQVIAEAGETSAPALNAMLMLAKLHRTQAHFSEAADFAEYVLKTLMPERFENEEWKALSIDVKAERFRLAELAVPDLVECLMAAGKTGEACKWALYFHNAWKREGLELSPMGSLALLAAARTLCEAGGFIGGPTGNLRWFENEQEFAKGNFPASESRTALEFALKTAQDVNNENKGNTLQVRAQKLISDVISRPGVVVPPDVLFEAAQGEYNTQNYARAAASLKGVMRALEGRDDATRREYMPKVLNQLGLTYGKQNRPLEAAMAFREGATTWKGDPEYQPRLAQGFYREISSVRRAAAGDKMIEDLFLFGERLIKESDTGSGADLIRWREAERAYDQANYDDARKSYLALGTVADEHEKGIVKAALCLYKKNDKEGARKEFRAYLQSFVTNQANAISGARKLAAREEARAQATYYLGKMAYDAQAWDEVVQTFTGYEKQFLGQTEYAPNALNMLVLTHIARRDLAAARGTVKLLESAFATQAPTGKAAFSLYQALKAEQEASNDPAKARALKKEMARYLRLSNRAASEPSFANLRCEAALWLELEEWVTGEETLRSTLGIFEKKPERATDLERFVKPDLGAALLGQRRVPEAFAVLDPLIPKDASDTRKPSAGVVADWCRAVTGWVVEEGTGLVEVPGVGGNFQRATELLDKLIDAERVNNEAWSCPWYELKFERIYALWQWSKSDSSYKAIAKRVLDDIGGQLGDPDLKDVAAKCGNESLRKRFLWVRWQLR